MLEHAVAAAAGGDACDARVGVAQLAAHQLAQTGAVTRIGTHDTGQEFYWDVNGTEMKGYELLTQSSENMVNFGIGTVVSFIVAMIAIKTFITFLQKHGFKMFGYYRIIVGIIMLFVLGLR